MNIDMTASSEPEPGIPFISESTPQRPKKRLKRLSSGITNVLPSFRPLTPRQDLTSRATTTSNVIWQRGRQGAIVAESGQLPVLPVKASTTDELEQPCLYDPSLILTFATSEKRRCSFCGMRGPKVVHTEPYYARATDDTGSHMCSAYDRPHTQTKHLASNAASPDHHTGSSSSALLGPRPVSPERAAGRIGNPPRVSRLPPGVICLPTANRTQVHQDSKGANSSHRIETTSRGSRRYDGYTQKSGNIGKEEPVPKPSSPKLHHIHGLPNSEDFSFVHRHEIPKHAIALRAGSTSPLTDRSTNLKYSPSVRGPSDFSDTVYYSGKNDTSSASQTSTQKPHITTVFLSKRQGSEGTFFDFQQSPLDSALTGSKVYRKHSPQQTQPTKFSQTLTDITDSGTTFGSQDTASTTIGGKRLELRGGSPAGDLGPKLRGGSGHERLWTDTFGFKLKRWLLTCHGPCPDDFDADSDGELPPSHAVPPGRVAQMHQKMNGRASLPAHLSKKAPAIFSMSNSPLSGAAFSSTPPRTPSSFHFPVLDLPTLHHRRPMSSITQPTSLTPPHVLTPPIAHLRGGAASPDEIPPTLFWLAGGKGEPINFNSWKQSRPSKRMGGLFGLAVFGERYGKVYKDDSSEAPEVQVSCSASIKATADDAGSLRSAHGSADASRPSSSSGSSASSVAEPVRESPPLEGDVAPSKDNSSKQRAPLSSPTARTDDVPLCSGALPIEPSADSPAAWSSRASSSHDNDAKASEAKDDRKTT